MNKKEPLRNPSPDRIIFLDNYRAMAIIMVIIVHSLAYCQPLTELQRQSVLFISQIAVPIFFFTDGYLFARSVTLSKTYHYLKKMKKNIFRLLFPWTVFTVFYTLARYFLEASGFLKHHTILGHQLSEVMLSAYGSAIAPQMYFLLSLFLIRLFCPVFKKIVLDFHYSLLLAVFICYLILYRSNIGLISPLLHIEGGQEPILHAIWGFQYYLVGIIFYKTSTFLNLRKLSIPFLLLFVITLYSRDRLGVFAFIVQYLYLISSFLFFELIGHKLAFLEKIGKNTMGIYLIHAPIVLSGVAIISNNIITTPMLSFFAIVSGTLLCSYIGTVIVINYIPFGPLLFGNTLSTVKSTKAQSESGV